MEGKDGTQIFDASRESLRPIANQMYRHRWFLYAFTSACCYALAAITVSTLAGDISSFELVFLRVATSLIGSLVVTSYNGIAFKYSSLKELILHIANTILAVTAMCSQYYAFQNMPTADASAIIYSYTALAGLFARIALKEQFGFIEAMMVLISFTGVVFIARPTFIFHNLRVADNVTVGFIPILSAISGSIFAALSLVVIRALGKRKIPVERTVLYFSLFATLGMVGPMTYFDQWSFPCSIWARIRAVFTGLITSTGYVLLNLAVGAEDAVYVSLVTINDVLLVFLMEIIFFGFTPQWMNILGMIFIVGSSVVVSLKKIILVKQKPKEDSRNDDSKIADSGNGRINQEAAQHLTSLSIETSV